MSDSFLKPILSIGSSDFLIGNSAPLQINLSNTSGLQALDLVLSYNPIVYSIPSSTDIYSTTEPY